MSSCYLPQVPALPDPQLHSCKGSYPPQRYYDYFYDTCSKTTDVLKVVDRATRTNEKTEHRPRKGTKEMAANSTQSNADVFFAEQAQDRLMPAVVPQSLPPFPDEVPAPAPPTPQGSRRALSTPPQFLFASREWRENEES